MDARKKYERPKFEIVEIEFDNSIASGSGTPYNLNKSKSMIYIPESASATRIIKGEFDD